jgi:LuxR family transcriptional regulator, transcriptional regulator of spore coat protein
LGAGMASTEVTDQRGLTEREMQVLELAAYGYSAKQIASQMGIAPRTVEGHIETVRLKMRARNKAHMVRQAVQSGVLKIHAA